MISVAALLYPVTSEVQFFVLLAVLIRAK